MFPRTRVTDVSAQKPRIIELGWRNSRRTAAQYVGTGLTWAYLMLSLQSERKLILDAQKLLGVRYMHVY